MPSPCQISIIIPVYNEATNLRSVVERIRSLGLPGAEIIVVDDGSTDGSSEIALDAGASVIRHPYNIGNGAAVKSGIRAARGRLLVLIDGDGQHKPEDIPKLLAAATDYHMVVGARAKGSKLRFHRYAANVAYNLFASYVTRFKVKDLTSGFRGARLAVLREFLHLIPNGFSTPTTTTLACIKAGYNVRFHPIEARQRTGQSKIRLARDGTKFLLIILKIVTLYSPLKVFFPIAALSFLLGSVYGAWNVWWHGKIPMGAGLLIQLAVIVFLFGLISEQIAASQDRK